MRVRFALRLYFALNSPLLLLLLLLPLLPHGLLFYSPFCLCDFVYLLGAFARVRCFRDDDDDNDDEEDGGDEKYGSSLSREYKGGLKRNSAANRSIISPFRESGRDHFSVSRAIITGGAARRLRDMALGSASRISIASLSHNRRSLLAPTWGEVARSSVFRHNIVIGALA